jgi:hypothetical protein
MTPPLALLLLLDAVVLGLAAALTWTFGAHPLPVFILGGSVLVTAVALVLAWFAGGSRFVTAGSLFRAPFYLLWKLPMYLSFARHGAPKTWHRTDRSQRR